MTVLADENQPPVPLTQRELRVRRPGGRRPRRAAARPPRRAGTCRACRGGSARGRRRRCWSGSAPPTRSLPSSTNGPPSPLLAEAERLERQQHHRRERVVDLADVDVVGRDAGRARTRARPQRTRGRLGEVVPLAHRRVATSPRRCRAPTPAASRRSRARSSVVSTTAPPPSLRMQQCSFVSGSAIIARALHVVDRDRVAVVRLGVERRVVAGRHRDLGELLDRRAELVHVPARRHRVLRDQRVPERHVELHRAAGAEAEVGACGGAPSGRRAWSSRRRARRPRRGRPGSPRSRARP